MPRRRAARNPAVRIGIPFDNDDQLRAICHHLSAHNTSLYRTPIYVRDGVDGKYKRLQRGTGLYGFEIKQRKDDNPYTNPKKFPVLKYILICSTDEGGVDTPEYLDWKFSWDENLRTVYRGGERAIRTFPYTHTGTEDHFLVCNKTLPAQVSMHNDDYLAERERVVFKVQRWTRLREENTDAWTRAGMGPKGPKGLKSVDNHTARYNDEFVKESAAGYYVGSMGVEKDPGVLEPVPFATKAEAQAFSDELHEPVDRQRAARWAQQKAKEREGQFALWRWKSQGGLSQEELAARESDHQAKQEESLAKDTEEELSRIRQARAVSKPPSLEAWQAKQQSAQAATAQEAARRERTRALEVAERQQKEKWGELCLRKAEAKAAARSSERAAREAAQAQQKADTSPAQAASKAEAAKRANEELATKHQAAESKQPEAVAALKAAQKAAKAAEGKAARADVTAQTNATLATEAHARAKEAMQLSNAKKRELEELEAMTPETAAAKKQRGKIRRARGRRRSLK